jgi:hypothetical protein
MRTPGAERGKKSEEQPLFRPHPPSWLPQTRSRSGSGSSSLCLSFLSFPLSFVWCVLYLFETGLGGGQMGSLQRAAIAQTVAGKRIKCTPL